MTEHVEARSLSTINFLAANPPQYPYSTQVHEALVLYISRVPGTRDIILSTFKPQKKNVTAEDVTNSLYYVHLDSDSDALLAPPHQIATDISTPRSSGESERSTIRRKPLPASSKAVEYESQAFDGPGMLSLPRTAPRLETDISAHAAMALPQHVVSASSHAEGLSEGYRANPMFQNKRHSQQQPHVDFRPPSPQSPGSPTTTIARKPVGPWRQVTPLPLSNVRPSTPNSQSYREAPGKQAAPLPPTASIGYGPLPTSSPTQQQPYRARRMPSPTKPGRPLVSIPFLLTIIRRDPSSGQQWNVGTVSSFQTNIPVPELAGPDFDPANAGDPHERPRIDVRLDTSGYAKYRGLPTRRDVEDAYRPASASSVQQSLRGFNAHGMSMDEPSFRRPAGNTTEAGFTRQVVMTYTKSWASNIKHVFRRRGHRRSRSAQEEGSFFASDDLMPPRPLHMRQHSSGSITSADSAAWDSGHESPPFGTSLITEPGPGLKARGYVFLSPWDGRCEFHTGNGGRSLKCQHVLDAGDSSVGGRIATAAVQMLRETGRSPPATSPTKMTGSGSGSSSRGAKPVSELRFNLPGGEVFKQGERQSGSGSSKMNVQFGKLLRSDVPASDDEYDEPMDLSLGREKAGGGNRGKRAKLGKLIVYDEGLKMLDLVIAANVGVWWTAWERSL